MRRFCFQVAGKIHESPCPRYIFRATQAKASMAQPDMYHSGGFARKRPSSDSNTADVLTIADVLKAKNKAVVIPIRIADPIVSDELRTLAKP